jgi:hypothetical protein
MPNTENRTLEELETAAKAGPSLRTFTRLKGIKALAMGLPHGQVAALFGVNEDSVSRWVRRFNDRGIDGDLPPNYVPLFKVESPQYSPLGPSWIGGSRFSVAMFASSDLFWMYLHLDMAYRRGPHFSVCHGREEAEGKLNLRRGERKKLNITL